MAEKMNAVCAICGNKYHMCQSCPDVQKIELWKLHTDTPEHYKIYQIIHGYSTGVYNKNEAKQKLQTVDLSDLEFLRDNIKSIINELLDYCQDDNAFKNKSDTAIDVKSMNNELVKKYQSNKNNKKKLYKGNYKDKI